jgi:hypothetical protein
VRLLALLRAVETRWDFATHLHRNTRGEPLNFDDFRPLVDLYRSPAPHIVIKSAVQSGKTTYALVDSLAWAATGLNTLYVLPKFEIRDVLVANRLAPLLTEVPEYARLHRRGGTDTLSMKHWGKATMRFVGSNSITEFKEYPADVLLVDELDWCDQRLLPYAYDRLAASPYGFVREFGNPTLPGVGIDDLYENSDRRHWYLPCPTCGEDAPVDWEHSVVEETASAAQRAESTSSTWRLRDSTWTPECGRELACICPGCGNPFDRLAPGHWVADKPDEAARPPGFLLNRLMSPFVPLEHLWSDFQGALGNDVLLQQFWNSNLGLAYVPLGGKVTTSLVASCVDPGRRSSDSAEDAVMGVDVGTIIYWEVAIWSGERKVVLAAGTCRMFEELDQVFAAFRVKACIIDALPEQRKASEFAARHARRVWLAFYAGTSDQGRRHWLVHWDDANWAVDVNRTTALGLTLARFQRHLTSLPNDLPPDYARHVAALVRVAGVDVTGNPTVKYVSTGPDHFAHASTYCEIARLRARVGPFSVTRYYEPPPGHEGEIWM